MAAHGKSPAAQFCHPIYAAAAFSAGRDASAPYHH
jgi:hypothetical protein